LLCGLPSPDCNSATAIRAACVISAWLLPLALAGFFAKNPSQLECINCDILKDVFQESAAQTFCVTCPTATRRYLGVLSAANRTACQCKEGVATPRTAHSPGAYLTPYGLLTTTPTTNSAASCAGAVRAAGFYNALSLAGEVRPTVLSSPRHSLCSAGCRRVLLLFRSARNVRQLHLESVDCGQSTPRLCRSANVCQWPIHTRMAFCLLQALLGFAVTASCHSRSVSVRSADRSMQHCLSCAIPRD
jgi:hypothetical protein